MAVHSSPSSRRVTRGHALKANTVIGNEQAGVVSFLILDGSSILGDDVVLSSTSGTRDGHGGVEVVDLVGDEVGGFGGGKILLGVAELTRCLL